MRVVIPDGDKVTDRQKQMLVGFLIGFVIGLIAHRILAHLL